MSTDMGEIEGGFRQFGEEMIAKAIPAVERFALYLVGVAAQITPVKTGALQASQTVDSPTFNGSIIVVLLGFNTVYAAAVHERFDIHHDFGQAKFLEVTLRNEGPALTPYVAAAVKQ